MGFLGFGKKDRILDLGERYRKQQEKIAQKKEEDKEENPQSSPQGAFSFLGNLASSKSEQAEETNFNEGDKKRKLAKRLVDMTSKIEDLSNQIYHLQQRIEVLERKSGVGSY